VKAQTESEVIAAQYQALETKYHETNILQRETNSKCRPSQKCDETVEHIIRACPILTNNNT
jgi:hypothetical protein